MVDQCTIRYICKRHEKRQMWTRAAIYDPHQHISVSFLDRQIENGGGSSTLQRSESSVNKVLHRTQRRGGSANEFHNACACPRHRNAETTSELRRSTTNNARAEPDESIIDVVDSKINVVPEDGFLPKPGECQGGRPRNTTGGKESNEHHKRNETLNV